MNGKGDKPRPIADREKYRENYDQILWTSDKAKKVADYTDELSKNIFKKDTESSNGRTADFGSANQGSSPCSVTKNKPLDK